MIYVFFRTGAKLFIVWFVSTASGTVTDQQGQSKANAVADAGTVGKAAQSNATESAGMDHLHKADCKL